MDVLSLNLPPCCHISLSYIMAIDIKIMNQSIPTTRSYASSCCHYCHNCNVDFVLFHNVTCYTSSLLLCIIVNIAYLLDITCTLVAPCMILEKLEWIKSQFIKVELFTKDENCDNSCSHLLRVSLW
jgi:predicted glycosyltransferase involved in capsule biosynthesis